MQWRASSFSTFEERCHRETHARLLFIEGSLWQVLTEVIAMFFRTVLDGCIRADDADHFFECSLFGITITVIHKNIHFHICKIFDYAAKIGPFSGLIFSLYGSKIFHFILKRKCRIACAVTLYRIACKYPHVLQDYALRNREEWMLLPPLHRSLPGRNGRRVHGTLDHIGWAPLWPV